MSIEVVITHVTQIEGRQGSRNIALLRIDENDPKAEPEQLQPIDGQSLTVVMHALRKIAAQYKKARDEFGDPAS